MSQDGIIFRGECEVSLTVDCTCGDTVDVVVTANPGGSDYPELRDMAYDAAGFSETGSCWTCDLSSAAEDMADSEMRDKKAEMEGSFAQ